MRSVRGARRPGAPVAKLEDDRPSLAWSSSMAAVAAVENLSATLDAATILELSGETSTSQVREVVVRGMRIASLDADSLCNEQWPRLEAVSLSQNPVGHDAVLWEWFGLCDSLRCLNLNFCGVESIEVRNAALYGDASARADGLRVAALRACSNWRAWSSSLFPLTRLPMFPPWRAARCSSARSTLACACRPFGHAGVADSPLLCAQDSDSAPQCDRGA